MKKLQKYFPIIYVAMVFFSFLYVRDVLKGENLDIKEAEQKEESIEVKPVDVTLLVDNGNGEIKYNVRMKNTNTFDDLLEDLRDDNRFFFEKTEYIYGTEYELINNMNAPEGYRWNIYENGKNITFETKGRELKDEAVYKIMLEPID